ncbi:MAG TPA: malto-oligosyltrehalose trehalohydrolase [Candidatus Sulfotelmatobacter sp.]|nr:malto-oligosyltrehalose trehalohydrolase [Candidatus Sulfotelmatobacter sp.]
MNSNRLGANRLSDGKWEFLVWAPNVRSVCLQLCGQELPIPMEAASYAYYRTTVEELEPGTEYFYRLDDGRKLPDPTSRFQPQGVHGPSQIVDLSDFPWTDRSWKGRDLESSVFYELHVGVYTREGTFNALIPHLKELKALGVTTIELMPIAQFPGSRNWGYDGVFPFAPQNTYGDPQSLQRLVDSAHAYGLSMALDVVYNHLGPEGNYLSAFGQYFTDRYHTPWGQAVNFDGPGSDEVRRFFIENAMCWLEDYHFDALRLDAVHGIFDFSADHFLAELKSAAAELSLRLGRQIHMIAESDLNDVRLLRDSECGGFNLDAQWSDDFHHSVHTLLTKENQGYYVDFGGTTPLAATLRDGWYYRGQYSESRKRRHGNSAQGMAATKFVVCNQNHDQVGNRAAGERLSELIKFEGLKLAAGITLLSPFVPFLFMGEEYGETAPFQYFISHGDPNLVEAVRRGRSEEFAAFGWQDRVPDPQDEQTFLRSHLDHAAKESEPHQTLYRLYQRLLQIRLQFKLGSRRERIVRELGESSILLIYPDEVGELVVLFNFGDGNAKLKAREFLEFKDEWRVLLYSGDGSWAGPAPNLPARLQCLSASGIELSAHSFVILNTHRPQAEGA